MGTVQKTEPVSAMKDGQAQTAACKWTLFAIILVLTQCSKYTVSCNIGFGTFTMIVCSEDFPGICPY
jgi:hypothetical protein